MKKRIVLGMSGGVDSSVAAYLLQKDGYEVIGITLLLQQARSHCTADNEKNARSVAKLLGIAHSCIDISPLFEQKVISYFMDEYMSGRTPNPCAVCNRQVKFKVLFDKALQLKTDMVATGHFARIIRQHNHSVLAAGKDTAKDQSYFLAQLPREWLAHIAFPLSTLYKNEVIEIARSAGIPVQGEAESQELCFVRDGDYRSFLLGRSGGLQTPGPILNREGHVIGEHKGILHYTIGQRRGLGLKGSKPSYVISIDPAHNAITVGEEKDVRQRTFRASPVNWLVSREHIPDECFAKIRSQHTAAKARLTIEGDSVSVTFSEPQTAITPGQLVVFYAQNIVLGSAWIQ